VNKVCKRAFREYDFPGKTILPANINYLDNPGCFFPAKQDGMRIASSWHYSLCQKEGYVSRGF
jgi:hypothetical protein